MLSKVLMYLIDQTIRSRGRESFVARRVTLSTGDAWYAAATVHGSLPYKVTLSRAELGIEGWCTCPYCTENAQVCKHMWATLLAAESRGFLGGDGRTPPIYMTVVDPDQEDALDDPEDVSTQIVSAATQPRGGAARTTPRRRPELPSWKKALTTLRSRPAKIPTFRVAPLSPGHQVVYVVQMPATLEANELVIEICTCHTKRNGQPSKPKPRRFSASEAAELPEAADRQILALLGGAREPVQRYYYSYRSSNNQGDVPATLHLTATLVEALLPRLCATGRCLRREPPPTDSQSMLQWDDAGAWELWLNLTPDAKKKSSTVHGELRRGEDRLSIDHPTLRLCAGLVFWDDRVAPLKNHNEAMPWVTVLRAEGNLQIPARQQQQFLVEVFGLPHAPRLDLPEELDFEEVVAAPRPCLKIQKSATRGWRDERDRRWLKGELAFEYAGHVVPAASPNRGVFEPEQRRLHVRDLDAERALAARLETAGFQRKYDYGREETLELLATKLPATARALIQEGWRVEAEGKLYREASHFQVNVTSAIDWFELHGTARFGDHDVPLPTLLAALKRGEDLVPLGDGSFGLLPEEWLKKYVSLADMGTAEGDHLQFRRTQVGLLDALLAEMPEARFDAQFERAREQLTRFQGVEPADPPPGFQGELRGYQRDGLGWLNFLQQFGFGGCLADDMGLGKTVQVLALLETRRALRAGKRGSRRPPPSLVVVPRSLVFNWKQEAARFAPELRILDHTGIARSTSGENFDDFDVILTTYGTLRRDIVELRDYPFDYAILDEAQAIKNASSQSAKAARLVQAEHRLALSGTPVENHLGELWSLFEFLNPGMLGNAAAGKGLELHPDGGESRSILARALRPYLLRRTKEQVVSDLPGKTEQTIYCDLEPAQRALYDELREHYRNALLGRVARDGIKKSKIQILEALLRLRQAACHPGLIDKSGPTDQPSAKLDVLLPQLREVVDEGHKSLVFSQFTSLLAIVRKRLDEEGIPYEYLDGRTRDRQARVESFQNDPSRKVFLISLKAGGLGLNLTAADYIFLLDPWWNPAVESQAIDRAHRIGQSRPVFAYRLIARDTVEEKVLELQAQKRDLADAIITADNSLIRDLGREELELLLS